MRSPDCPLIPGDASTEEAVRLKAVYDARRSRLASEVEALRLEIDTGRTITRVRHRDGITELVQILLSHLGILVEAGVALVPPEKQPMARHAMDKAVRRRRSVSLGYLFWLAA
jgi:hypothetical protein